MLRHLCSCDYSAQEQHHPSPLLADIGQCAAFCVFTTGTLIDGFIPYQYRPTKPAHACIHVGDWNIPPPPLEGSWFCEICR